LNLVPGAVLNVSIFLYRCAFQCGVGGSATAARTDSCEIPENLLNDGCYYLRLLIVRDSSVVIFAQRNVAAFEVRDLPGGAWYGKWQGAVRPALKWSTEVVSAEPLLVCGGAAQ
jgi:lipopolysaccharide transport system ATP-binding protein